MVAAILILILAACSGASTTETADPTSTTEQPRSGGTSEGDTNPESGADDANDSSGAIAFTPDSGSHTATSQPSDGSGEKTSTSTTHGESATTTTSANSSTPPPGGPGGTGTAYGVAGCSNTGQAVNGYTLLTSVGILTPGSLGGGSAPKWGDPADSGYNTYWGLYDERRPANGYDGAWVQICLRSGEHNGAFDAPEQMWVSHIIEQVKSRDPGITIWISPLNFYEGIVCSAAGADGPAIAAAAADWAASTFAGVQRGPDLGPLKPEHIGVRDDCHPNQEGELLLGSQLVAFFD